MSCYRNNDSIHDTLERNIGNYCTIYCEGQSREDGGFSGILASVDYDTCSLVRSGYNGCYDYDGANNGNGRRNNGRRCFNGCDPMRTQVIAIDKIVCVTTSFY